MGAVVREPVTAAGRMEAEREAVMGRPLSDVQRANLERLKRGAKSGLKRPAPHVGECLPGAVVGEWLAALDPPDARPEDEPSIEERALRVEGLLALFAASTRTPYRRARMDLEHACEAVMAGRSLEHFLIVAWNWDAEHYELLGRIADAVGVEEFSAVLGMVRNMRERAAAELDALCKERDEAREKLAVAERRITDLFRTVPVADIDDDLLGQVVRATWVRWCKERIAAGEVVPAHHLVPWPKTTDAVREIDRRIGREVARVVLGGKLPLRSDAGTDERWLPSFAEGLRLREEVKALRSILDGADAPSIAELQAHDAAGGVWLVAHPTEGAQVCNFVMACAVREMGAGDDVPLRWWAIGRDGKLCKRSEATT